MDSHNDLLGELAADAALEAASRAMTRLAYEEAAALSQRAAGVYERVSRRAALAIALSIMAEVVAVRNGREGGRLRDKRGGRIHEIGETVQPANPRASA